MYNKKKEKEKVLEMLQKSSQDEIKFNKEQNFLRSIELALDEIEEFESHYKEFISNVSHLEVFQEVIKEPLTTNVDKLIETLKYLIEKNYTKEDKENMPEDVLRQVRSTQEKRFKLLKRIAIKYLSKPNQD